MKNRQKKVGRLITGEKVLICDSYDNQMIYLVRMLKDDLYDYEFRLVEKDEIVFCEYPHERKDEKINGHNLPIC